MSLQAKSVLRFVLFAFLALLIPGLAVAQTATITGTATDSTGATVPKAAINVHNLQTGLDRSGETSDTGTFTISNIPPGHYTISFSKAGFRKVEYIDVTLLVDQIFALNAKLEVSPVAQTVEVSGQTAPPVDTQSGTISNVVDSEQLLELPLLTRDPYSLVLLSPGVIQSNSGLGGFSANGTRERDNNFLLDGVDNNDTSVPGIPGGITSLNPDETQEFRVITNNFSAEYGRNDGAVIDIITRGGTNQLHGDAYWFGRYSALAANDFFNNAAGLKRNPFVRNDFGASVGGPIIKNKTFWFANYEGQRFITTLTNQAVVPNPDFKTGVFTYAGTPVDISTPSSANNAFGLPLDPSIQSILALYPSVPNGPAVDDLRSLDFFGSASRSQSDNFTIRVDHNITPGNLLTARYVFNRFNDPNPFHSDFLPGGLGDIATYQRTQNWGIALTSTIRSNLINELRLGANRTNLQFNCAPLATLNQFSFIDAFGHGADFAMPDIAGFGCGGLGDSDGQARFTGTYSLNDHITWVKGSHSLKFGGEYRNVYSNGFNDFFTRTALDFSSCTNFGVAVVAGFDCPSNRVLQDMSSMLLGLADEESQTQLFDTNQKRQGKDVRGWRQHEGSVFAEDSWKLRSNLTLTLGLRWDYYGVPFEQHGLLSNLTVPADGAAPFTFTTIGGSAGGELYNRDYNDWGPRVGFAWDPFKNGKTSIRGAYGIFYDRTYDNLFGNIRGNPPFEPTFFVEPFVPVSTITTAPGDVSPSPTVDDLALITPVIIDQKFKTPRSQNWNFGNQRQIAPALTFEANYVGRHSNRIFRVLDGNPPDPTLVAQLEAFCGNPANPFGCSLATLQGALLWFGAEVGAIPFDAVHNNAFFQADLLKSISEAKYNGLQTKTTLRNYHGLLAQLSYTYSHAIDNASDPLVAAAGNRSFPRNSHNLRAELGNSDFDVRHRAVLNFIYSVPIGRGTSHLSGGFGGRVLEGWKLGGIATWQTGLPFDVFGNRDSQHTGLSDRATIIGNPSQPSGTDKTFTGPALSAFELTPFNQASNLGRNSFYGPGVNNWDMILSKDTSITERLKFQLRFEFYNLFNRAGFAQPDNLIQDTSTFGESTSTVSRPDGTTSARQIQFGAKLIF